MSEASIEKFKNVEEVIAAAQFEFQVDISDAGAVHTKAIELALVANRSHKTEDFAASDRLTDLFEAYQGFATPEALKKAA